MKATRVIAGALLACCLMGMMVLPAAAASDVQQMNARVSKIDAGLAEDLWKTHMENRLEAFDMHVRHGKDIIGVLEAHGIDASGPQGILDQFGSLRPELEQALSSHDRDAIKTVNGKLVNLAKQFLNAVREAIRASAGTGTATATAGFMLPASGTTAI
jgi:hypothetical protein